MPVLRKSGSAVMTLRASLVALAAALLSCPGQARAEDPLAEGFRDPPASARPLAWWHWMNGNVSREGIELDLAWMKRIGLAGVQQFDLDLMTPRVVARPLGWMGPEWKDAFRLATTRARELGLEFTVASSPGWSSTGGPWVRPEEGAKKLVWSETEVSGGRPVRAKLPMPPGVSGPFQAIPLASAFASASAGASHYGDVAVLAYPAADGVPAVPQVSTSAGKALDPALLADGDLTRSVRIDAGSARHVLLRYDRPRTIRSATLFVPGLGAFASPAVNPVLEAKVEGTWRRLADLPVTAVPTTASLAPVTASEFRLVLVPAAKLPPMHGEPAAGVAIPSLVPPADPDAALDIAELALDSRARVDRFEAKAAFALVEDYGALPNPGDDAAGVDPAQVIDLTGRMQPDGTLDWTPPPGNWRILRLGHSLTGKVNHPAPAAATGLEVDKLDRAAVRAYLEHYLDLYGDAAGAGAIGGLLTDSTEVGAFNWTPAMMAQFRRLRGYDPLPFLPALTGVIVGTRERSDRFLHDFRQTLADLHATEHYGTVAAVARERGLKVYGEALEDKRPSPGDDMALRAAADVPMAALWTFGRGEAPRPTLLGDLKGAASVASLYGRNVAAAEALTSAAHPWGHDPADLRRVIDLAFASGINRVVISASTHQPLVDKVPGLSLLSFGQFFTRNETWAEMAKPWVDYLARTSFLLQQGRHAADVALFYGEDAPLTALYANGVPAGLPARNGFDFVNRDALLERLSVEDGDVVSAGGARFRLLQLGGTSHHMTLPVLRRLASLAEAGATVLGNAPEGSPSLADDRAEFEALRRRLWSGAPSTPVGKGRVIAGNDVASALSSIGVGPDFTYSGAGPDAEVLFVHRRLSDGSAYFLTNRKNRPETIEARFRVAGKVPEIWRADTGSGEPVAYRIEGGETVVPLAMAAEDSFFVVFRKPAETPSATPSKPVCDAPEAVNGAWQVAFEAGRGAPSTIALPALAPLSAQAEPGVRYFSGTATYTKRFRAPHRRHGAVWLDLGAVGDVAEVRVNGALVGTAWKPPYRLDIGKAVRPGTNALEVRVANLWVNRLIGDAQPGAAKVTFTTFPTYRADAPLRPSGLIGPVALTRCAPVSRVPGRPAR